MKIRRFLSACFVVLCAVVVIFGVTSCTAHEHSFSEWETVSESTCASIGLEKRTCECGQAEYNTKDTVAHTPVTDAGIEATCTSLGKTEGSHCSECGVTITAQSDIPMIKHSFSAWETVAPTTCTAFGLEKRVCACGQVEYNVENAFSHTTVTDDGVAATCTESGKTEGSHCSECGVVLVAQRTIPALGHKIGEAAIVDEAYCNHDGIKSYSCENTDCEYSYEESYSLPVYTAEEILAAAEKYTGYVCLLNQFGEHCNDIVAFVIRSDGIIVTSNTELDNFYRAFFNLGEESYEVTHVLAYSEDESLAVLKVDATDLPTANICTKNPVPGETVYNIGEYYGYSAISSGVVTVVEDYNDDILVHHDARLIENYFGGPVINRYGEVVAINTGVHNQYEEENTAVSVVQIEKLDFTNPITMEEYGKQTYTPVEQVRDWTYDNSNTNNENETMYAYAVLGDKYYFALIVDTEDPNEGFFVEGYWVTEDNCNVCTRIYFTDTEGVYRYYASYDNGAQMNETTGYLYADDYNKSTILTYETYYGRYWTESDLMALYSEVAYKALDFLSYCLDTYFFDYSLETFGFNSLSYDKDEDALNKLNNLVVEHGRFIEDTGEYELSMQAQATNGEVYFRLAYIPATENTPSSTEATAYYYMTTGHLYCVTISLNNTDLGNIFEVLYAFDDGTGLSVQSSGWGYLDPNILTIKTDLVCYVFEGMNEYEDGLFINYANVLWYNLEWLDYLLAGISPELSIRDLGFYYYFNKSEI